MDVKAFMAKSKNQAMHINPFIKLTIWIRKRLLSTEIDKNGKQRYFSSANPQKYLYTYIGIVRGKNASIRSTETQKLFG